MLQFSSEKKWWDVKQHQYLHCHTLLRLQSRNVLYTCVYMLVCLDRPLTVNEIFLRWQLWEREWRNIASKFLFGVTLKVEMGNGKREREKAQGCRNSSSRSSGCWTNIGQPTCAKMPYELQRVVRFLLQENTSRDLSYKNFWWGMEANTLCYLKKDPVEP